MNSDAKSKAAKLFADAFAKCLGESFGKATGAQWPLEARETPDAVGNKGTPVHLRLTVEGAVSGECFAEFYESQIVGLVAKAAQQEGAATPEDPGEALTTLVASAMEELSACVSAKFGAVTIKVERVAGLAFGGMFVVPIAAAPENANLQILLYFGAPLLEALSARTEGGGSCEVNTSTVLPKNLKLVMDVELNVTLRFGQRQMPLREVLELGSGSVVELDRMVDEPVELLLDGKLIARGEAVVVDGNYGLRVTEIPQPVTSHFLN